MPSNKTFTELDEATAGQLFVLLHAAGSQASECLPDDHGSRKWLEMQAALCQGLITMMAPLEGRFPRLKFIRHRMEMRWDAIHCHLRIDPTSVPEPYFLLCNVSEVLYDLQDECDLLLREAGWAVYLEDVNGQEAQEVSDAA